MIAAQLNALAGDIIFEVVRAIALAAVIVLAVFLGSRIRKIYDKITANKDKSSDSSAKTAESDGQES